MKNHHIQRTSVAFFLASVILEVGMRTSKIDMMEHTVSQGISLGLILAAIGLNVTIVKKMGVAKEVKNISQIMGIVYTIYAFVLYIFIPV